eukprot:g27352.t1
MAGNVGHPGAHAEGPQSKALATSSGVIAISKPAGVTTEDLVEALQEQCQPHGSLRIVSRLDHPTSGVLPLAVGIEGSMEANWLRAQFAGRLVSKEYLCLCEGAPFGARGTINAPLLTKEVDGVSRSEEMHNLKAECHELSSQLEGMEAHRQKVLRDFQQLQEASRRTATKSKEVQGQVLEQKAKAQKLQEEAARDMQELAALDKLVDSKKTDVEHVPLWAQRSSSEITLAKRLRLELAIRLAECRGDVTDFMTSFALKKTFFRLLRDAVRQGEQRFSLDDISTSEESCLSTLAQRRSVHRRRASDDSSEEGLEGGRDFSDSELSGEEAPEKEPQLQVTPQLADLGVEATTEELKTEWYPSHLWETESSHVLPGTPGFNRRATNVLRRAGLGQPPSQKSDSRPLQPHQEPSSV